MRIRILHGISGQDFTISAGAEIDLPADEARHLVDSGDAEVVRDPPKKAKPATAAKTE